MSLPRFLGAPSRRLAALACLLLALPVLSGCGGEETTPSTTGLGDLTPPELTASLEAEASEFFNRPDSALGVSLREFLGSEITTEVEQGSAICRSGRDTPSIDDPKRYPFACVVRGKADGRGLLVEISLGFVGTGVEGRCWRAVNERVLVTTTRPATLSKAEATKPPNRLEGCA